MSLYAHMRAACDSSMGSPTTQVAGCVYMPHIHAAAALVARLSLTMPAASTMLPPLARRLPVAVRPCTYVQRSSYKLHQIVVAVYHSGFTSAFSSVSSWFHMYALWLTHPGVQYAGGRASASGLRAHGGCSGLPVDTTPGC